MRHNKAIKTINKFPISQSTSLRVHLGTHTHFSGEWQFVFGLVGWKLTFFNNQTEKPELYLEPNVELNYF